MTYQFSTNLSNSAPSPTALSQDARFKDYARRLAMLLASVGVKVGTYAPGLPYFSKLSPEQKQQANEHIGFYYEICREQLSAGYSLRDGTSFLWRAFKKLNLVPRSDLFQCLKENTVYEIYSENNIQLFRNIHFFENCSYTLEELHSREWWILFQRDSKITDALLASCEKVFSGEKRNSFVPSAPKHIVREVESADNLVLEYECILMSPLCRDKRPVAFFVEEEVRLLS